MKDKLPKRFLILRNTESPLWDKYIKWLNEYCTTETEMHGLENSYYGLEGTAPRCIQIHQNEVAHYAQLTLDQWHKLAYPEYEVVMVVDKPSDNDAVLKEKYEQLKYLAGESNDFYRDINSLYQGASIKERVRLENIKIALDNAVQFLTEDINRLNPPPMTSIEQKMKEAIETNVSYYGQEVEGIDQAAVKAAELARVQAIGFARWWDKQIWADFKSNTTDEELFALYLSEQKEVQGE